jgi:2,4-didehydro-3-deoxy-L-rhamnonate hydrolase
MKLCRFDDDRLGIVLGEEVADVTDLVTAAAPMHPWPVPLGDWFISNLNKMRPRLEDLSKSSPKKNLASVRLLSPVANPGKIIGAPGNYRDHVDEAKADAEIHRGNLVMTIEHHGLFLKANSSLVGPSHGVPLRFPNRRTDYEGELVVVIGSTCSGVKDTHALAHVAGYCCGLDMTLRGPEERSLRKSIDGYTVLGPWLTTADEVGAADNLMIRLQVNGSTRQSCSTSSLIHSVSKVVAYASTFYTLHPGDVILTGTPAGVGEVRAGDNVELSIDKLGAMKVAIYNW